MTIQTRDHLINALGNNSSRLVIDKASISNTAAGQFFSTWLAAGQPGAGATPGAAAVCDSSLLGSFDFAQQTAPAQTYAAYAYLMSSNNTITVEVHDRLCHMGGLSGTSTSAQTVNLTAVQTASNFVERMGRSDYSEIQWWLECYTGTGTTSANATVAVTYNDASTGSLTTSLGTSMRSGRAIPLNGLIPASASGKYIRAINSVTLSATTGTTGSFGFTATRPRCTMPLVLANKVENFDWASLGLPEISNEACLMLIVMNSTTTTGTIRGGLKLAHG